MPSLLPGRLLLFAVFLLISVNLHARESEISRPLFFTAPAAEAVWYGRTSPSIGYGFAFGSDDTVSIGLKGMYSMPLSENDISTLEITFFLRIYLSAADIANGFFVQLTHGFAVFSGESKISLPTEGGAISIGITAGRRFSLGNRFFIEPYIRGGYPYYGGVGLSAGVRF